jgi:hypothetical protein
MEGAVWLGKRVANEIEKVCQTVDGIIIEYNQRAEGFKFDQTSFGGKNTDVLNLQRNQVWFLEAIKHSTMELYETTITMLESAVFHMEEAQTRLGDLTQSLDSTSKSAKS